MRLRRRSSAPPSQSPSSSSLAFGIAVGGKKSMTTSAGSSSSVLAPLVADGLEEVPLLEALDDNHGGVIVEIKTSMDPAAFTSSLRASLADWRNKGIRGVWIKLPIELAKLVDSAVEEGFRYHHAEPSYLMLVYWIPETNHTLPINATHRVRIGAFVMNDKREVLVVQEKLGILRGTGLWKFPTGVLEQGEDIHTGAVREVKEETGIDTEFVEVLAFRQSHMSFFGKSELLFVCMLRPLSFVIHPQESEIEAAQWMLIDEYARQPLVQKHELFKYMLDVCSAKIGIGYSGFSPLRIRSAFSDKQDYLYFNTHGFQGSS